MPSEHDVRQRASICQDCWFWKEMSCALASPENGVCANKRPVHGRRVQAPAQAPLVPLAAGHAQPAMQPAAAVPFSEEAPEATFSLAQVRDEVPVASTATVHVQDFTQSVRTQPPSFREIRAGRAVAAARRPVAEVRISAEELDQPRLVESSSSAQPVLPGMDQLVERVRQRTAARLSRIGSPHPA